jgi:hypothetical protein
MTRRPPGGPDRYEHPLSVVRAERGWTYQDVVDVMSRVSGCAHRSGVDAACFARRILRRAGLVLVFVGGGTVPMGHAKALPVISLARRPGRAV